MFFLHRKFLVLIKYLGVPLVVDGVIRLIFTRPFLRVFFSDHRFRLVAEFKMLMLNNTVVWYVAFSKVYYRVTLVMFLVMHFLFKPEAAIFKLSELEIIKLVYFSGKNGHFGFSFPIRPVFKIIY